MPCRDFHAEFMMEKELRNKTDELTDMLCKLCRRIEDASLQGSLIKDKKLKSWWEKHKIEDKIQEERRKEEKHKNKVKKEALAKLTEEERKVLEL